MVQALYVTEARRCLVGVRPSLEEQLYEVQVSSPCCELEHVGAEDFLRHNFLHYMSLNRILKASGTF